MAGRKASARENCMLWACGTCLPRGTIGKTNKKRRQANARFEGTLMKSDPVLFIPPMLCDARVFLDQIAHLSRDHVVICAPPCGGETMEEIAALILAWAPAHFALVGASMGGMIALEIMRQAPERVTRLALINTIAQADTPRIASDRETQIIAAKAGRFADVIAHELNADRFHEDLDQATYGEGLRIMAEEIGADVYVQQARAVQKRKDQQTVLRKIRQPAWIISGDSDPDLPLRRQEFIAEMIPYATHEVIENAGFLPTIEQPDRVSDVLRAWLQQPLVLR